MKLSHGLEMPETRGQGPRKYPFPTMEVGDSFDIPVDEMKQGRKASLYNCSKRVGIRVAIRLIDVDNVYRVWRVE